MNRVRKAACVMLCVAAPLGSVAAQSGPEKRPSADQQSTPTVEQAKAIDPTLKKILSVLDNLIESQKSFQDNDLRIAIRAQVADLLWKYDEPRARKLIEEAFEAMAIAPVRERSIWVPAVGPNSHFPVRNVVIPALVRRDPSLAARLAEDLANSLPKADPELNPSGYSQYRERSLLLSQLASYVSSGDPRRAAQLARVFAERGDINHLRSLLSEIRMRDPKTASDLFVLALERSRLGQPSIDDVWWFGSYLFPYFGYSGDELIQHPSAGTLKADPYRTIKTDPKTVTQFLELAYEVVSEWIGRSKAAKSNTNYRIFKYLIPYFERFMPDKAASFRALAEEALRSAPEEVGSTLALNHSGTVQELLARAEKLTESRQKDALYSRASAQAMMSRNFDLAVSIINRIAAERVRANEMFNLRIRMYQFIPEDTERALERNEFETAEALISGTADADLRLRLFSSLIERLVYKDKARALQLLAEAEQVAFGLEAGVQRARQLKVLAAVSGRIDADRGFLAMKLAVSEFNRAGFVPEWEMYRTVPTDSEVGKETMPTNIGLSSLVNDSDFEWLGSKDLNRALAVAQEIQMKEASALAQLAVCQGALRTLQASTAPKPNTPPRQP